MNRRNFLATSVTAASGISFAKEVAGVPMFPYWLVSGFEFSAVAFADGQQNGELLDCGASDWVKFTGISRTAENQIVRTCQSFWEKSHGILTPLFGTKLRNWAFNQEADSVCSLAGQGLYTAVSGYGFQFAGDQWPEKQGKLLQQIADQFPKFHLKVEKLQLVIAEGLSPRAGGL